MNVLIVAGGTGGHLAPGLALAAEFAAESKDQAVLLTLPQNELSVARYGLPERVSIELYTAPNLKRGLLDLLLLPMRLLRALRQVRAVFARHAVQVVVGLGGYPSLPALLYCRLFSVPYFLCEQNAMPGRITRLFWKKARMVFLNFPVARTPLRSMVVGNPVRSAIENKASQHRRQPSKKPVVLVLGGSQGSAQINDLVLQALSLAGVRWLFQCGESQLAHVRSRLSAKGREDVNLFGFHSDPAELYSQADILVCRAGAGVLSEALLYGLPMLLIPYPYASDDHQKANAEVLVHAGAARMLYGKTIDPALFVEVLTSMLNDRPLLEDMSRKARSMARPGVARTIAGHIRSAHE